MVDNSILLLMQFSCLMGALLLVIVLVMSRVHQHNTTVGYETSRWMIISGLSLLVVHFWMQMQFGFRARSNEEGALINILFYSPVVYLIAFATIRMSCGHRYLKRYILTCGVGMVLSVASFVAGWMHYQTLVMPIALKTMYIIFFATIVTVIIMTVSELKRKRKIVEDETAVDIRNYDIYMHIGTSLLYAVGFCLPIAIISNEALAIFAPLFLLSLIFYVVSFVSLGFNISAVGEILEVTADEVQVSRDADENEIADTAEASERLSPEQIANIESLLEDWRTKRGFGVISLTCASLAGRLGIPKKMLSQYLSEHEGKTFRVWLSDLRIEEVKQMLLDNRDYSNEAIASECGFSSRSWMQEKFKATTGLTPNEWRDSKLKGEKLAKN